MDSVGEEWYSPWSVVSILSLRTGRNLFGLLHLFHQYVNMALPRRHRWHLLSWILPSVYRTCIHKVNLQAIHDYSNLRKVVSIKMIFAHANRTKHMTSFEVFMPEIDSGSGSERSTKSTLYFVVCAAL